MQYDQKSNRLSLKKIAVYCCLLWVPCIAVYYVRPRWKKWTTPYAQKSAQQAAAKHKPAPTRLQLVQRYLQEQQGRCAANTYRAKKGDLALLLQHGQQLFDDDGVDNWPQRMRAFEQHMCQCISPRTHQPYSAASANRLFNTLNHFSRWLHEQGILPQAWPQRFFRKLPAHVQQPCTLNDEQLHALQQAAATQPQGRRCPRRSAGLQHTVLQLLQHTGLRVSELVQLNVNQLRQNALHAVRRKGGYTTTAIPLAPRVCRNVAAYLKQYGNVGGKQIALLAHAGRRICVSTVTRICRDLCERANQLLPEHLKFHLTPHMLRHIFLQQVYRYKGLIAAYRASGNRTQRGTLCYILHEKPHVSDLPVAA